MSPLLTRGQIMKKQKIKSGSFVMNRKNGSTYMVSTDTVQSRNRRQLYSIASETFTQACESSLVLLDRETARMCNTAERLVRSRRKLSVKDKALLKAWRAFRSDIMG